MYLELSDNELLELINEQKDNDAMETLIKRYGPMITGQSRSLYIIGADEEDLIQEGMIGLFKAIRDYQEEKDSSFYHFAEICISRQMYTAMEASQRKKHAPLNSYVSLDEEPDNDGQIPLTEVLQSLTNGNPEDMVIDQENVEAFQKKIEKCLSKMEKEVLALTLQGLDYHQVAQIMDKSPKSIDNALQRIKGKLR